MKVYCVTKECFRGDDSHTIVVSIYRNKEKAIARMEELESIEGGIGGEYTCHFGYYAETVIE